MNKARYVPPRAQRTQPLGLPDHIEEEYIAQDRPQDDIYDAASIEELIEIDPDFRRYWRELHRSADWFTRRNPKRGMPPSGSGANTPKNPAWESFDDGHSGVRRGMPHGHAEGASIPEAIRRQGYHMIIFTDRKGGFLGEFYLPRRAVWILLTLLFLLFMAVVNFPDVVEIILKIL